VITVLAVFLCSLYFCARCISVLAVFLCSLYFCARCISVLAVFLCSLYFSAHCAHSDHCAASMLHHNLLFMLVDQDKRLRRARQASGTWRGRGQVVRAGRQQQQQLGTGCRQVQVE
jgi:hypothetical protein